MSNDEPQTLKDVALAASDKNGGARGRGLGRIAKDKGLVLSYTTVDKIIEGTYRSTPTRKTLEALAKLSGYSVEQVYAAAGEPMPLKPLAKMLPPDADLLDGKQRQAVLETIRLFAQQNRALATLQAAEREGGGGDADRPRGSAPTKPPESGPAQHDPDNVTNLFTVDDESVAANDPGKGQQNPGDPTDHET